jgi:hypothetical protein
VNRLIVLAGLLMWAGLTLLLSNIHRFNRPSLSERLRPYHPGAPSSDRLVDSTAPLRQLVDQVWVPVTVATLVPGVILIAVPFLSALHAFSNS